MLKITAQLTLDFGLQGRRTKGVFVRSYFRNCRGVKQFVKGHVLSSRRRLAAKSRAKESVDTEPKLKTRVFENDTRVSTFN